jgi:hypothetical protein
MIELLGLFRDKADGDLSIGTRVASEITMNGELASCARALLLGALAAAAIVAADRSAQADTRVSVGFLYDELAPDGYWVEDVRYGTVRRPRRPRDRHRRRRSASHRPLSRSCRPIMMCRPSVAAISEFGCALRP